MFRTKKKAHKKMGVSVGHNTKNAYENGDECVPILKRREMRMIVQIHIPWQELEYVCTYPGIRIIDMQTQVGKRSEVT